MRALAEMVRKFYAFHFYLDSLYISYKICLAIELNKFISQAP
jgi:hypothetical protein